MTEDTEYADVTDALRRYQPAAPTSDRLGQIAATLAQPRSSTRRWWLLATAAVVLIGVGTLWMLWRPAPVIEPSKLASSLAPKQIAEFKEAWFQQAREVLPYQTPDHGVTIVVFLDWLCPGCLIFDGDLRSALEPLVRQYPGRIVVIYEDWPWDVSCNSALQGANAPAHPGACELASAVRKARARGRDAVLVDWIKRHQLDWRDIGLPREFALPTLQPGLDPAVQESIENGKKLRIQGTPTVFINGVRITNLMPANYIDLAVRLELERASASGK